MPLIGMMLSGTDFGDPGDRVRAAWGDETGETGSYWAKCTGRPEKVLEGMSIRCWQGASMVIEGEQLGKGDGKHKYSRREVSADGSTMTLTWFDLGTLLGTTKWQPLPGWGLQNGGLFGRFGHP